MIRQGWKEFRGLGCRRSILVLYDVLWLFGFEWKAAGLLHRELRGHCKIPNDVLDEVFNPTIKEQQL